MLYTVKIKKNTGYLKKIYKRLLFQLIFFWLNFML